MSNEIHHREINTSSNSSRSSGGGWMKHAIYGIIGAALVRGTDARPTGTPGSDIVTANSTPTFVAEHIIANPTPTPVTDVVLMNGTTAHGESRSSDVVPFI